MLARWRRIAVAEPYSLQDFSGWCGRHLRTEDKRPFRLHPFQRHLLAGYDDRVFSQATP
jgi:hypothetical protein